MSANVLCTVSAAANTIKNAGVPVLQGTIEFLPVTTQGVPISFLDAGGNLWGSSPITASISGGAFTVALPDTSTTTPQNVCYQVRAWDLSTNEQFLGVGYETFQPTGAAVTFNTEPPNLPTLVTVQIGPSGQGFTDRGLWSANTVYSPYDVFTYNGVTYRVPPGGGFTSGATFSAAGLTLTIAAATDPLSPYTLGTAGQPVTGALPGACILMNASPATASGVVKSITATINYSVAAEDVLTCIIATVSGTTVSGIRTFNVTVSQTISANTVVTFNAGTDFASSVGIDAGECIGFVAQAYYPQVMYQEGASGPGFLLLNGTSTPAAGAWSQSYLTQRLDFAVAVQPVPAIFNSYTTPAQAAAIAATSAGAAAAAAVAAANPFATSVMGTSGQPVTGNLPGACFLLNTSPASFTGIIQSITATLNYAAPANNVLTCIIATVSGTTVSGLRTFNVTVSQTISANTVVTFNAGTDFASSVGINAGECIGFVNQAQFPQISYQDGVSGVGFLILNGTSTPAAGAWAQSYLTQRIDFSAIIGKVPAALEQYSTQSQTAAAIASALGGGTVTSQVEAAIVAYRGPITPNRATLWSETFSGSALPANWTPQAGTWTTGSGLLTPSDVLGYNSMIYFKRTFACNTRLIRVQFQIGSSGAVFGFGSIPEQDAYDPAGNYSSLITIDSGANAINILAGGYSGSNQPAIVATSALGFALIAGTTYLLTLTVDRRVLTVSVSDPTSGITATVVNGNNATTVDVPPWGAFMDYPCFVAISGQAKFTSFKMVAQQSPRVFFLGDSITYTVQLLVGQGWPSQAIAQIGGGCVISGRPGASSVGALERITDEVIPLAPRTVVLLIGTNDAQYGTGTPNISAYQANINAIVTALTAANINLILGTIIPKSGSQPWVTAANNFLLSLASPTVSIVRFDLAMSLNHDGITENPALYQGDATHPNPAGQTAMFNRLMIDAPSILD